MLAAGVVGGKRWAAARGVGRVGPRGAGKVGGQLEEGAGRVGLEGEGEHSCSQRLVEAEAGKELQRERWKGRSLLEIEGTSGNNRVIIPYLI